MTYVSKTNLKTGFTLIEFLLSMTILAIIAGVSAPIYNFFQVRNDIHVTTNILSQTLRRAQVLAKSSDGDSAWGVQIMKGQITLYKGNSYSTRDVNFDEAIQISSGLNLSGSSGIVFNKFSGIPIQTGTITISKYNEQQTITINPKGTLIIN